MISTQIMCDRCAAQVDHAQMTGGTVPSVRLWPLPGKWLMAELCPACTAQFFSWLADNSPQTTHDHRHATQDRDSRGEWSASGRCAGRGTDRSGDPTGPFPGDRP